MLELVPGGEKSIEFRRDWPGVIGSLYRKLAAGGLDDDTALVFRVATPGVCMDRRRFTGA